MLVGFSGPGGATNGWLAAGGGGGSGYETSGNAATTGGYGGGAAPARGSFWGGVGDGVTPPGAPPMTYALSLTTANAQVNSGSGVAAVDLEDQLAQIINNIVLEVVDLVSLSSHIPPDK